MLSQRDMLEEAAPAVFETEPPCCPKAGQARRDAIVADDIMKKRAIRTISRLLNRATYYSSAVKRLKADLTFHRHETLVVPPPI
jgi:hypothetical protein